MLPNLFMGLSFTSLPSANLEAHYDASVASSITEVTGVSNWADLSGNGRDLVQATGADQPVYSAANNSIAFDGVSHSLKTAAFTLNQPETIYIVMNQVSWTSSDYIIDGNANNSMYILQGTGTPNMSLLGGIDNADLAVGADGVVCAVINGASSSFKVNNNAAATGNTGASNGGGFTIGRPGAAASNFSNIIVYEVAIYSVAHSASEQSNIIKRLSARWGI